MRISDWSSDVCSSDLFGFYGRWLYFYDFVNNDFDETHRNIITPENVDRVGVTGDPISNRYFQHVYGPGAREKLKRNDGSTLRSIGTSFQMLDANIYGRVPLSFWDGHDLTFKNGRQTGNWGGRAERSRGGKRCGGKVEPWGRTV